MNTTHYFSTDDAGPDSESTKAELWGLLGALIALKVVFAVAILVLGTDGMQNFKSLAGQVAMHWMLVTVALVAVPVILLRREDIKT